MLIIPFLDANLILSSFFLIHTREGVLMNENSSHLNVFSQPKLQNDVGGTKAPMRGVVALKSQAQHALHEVTETNAEEMTEHFQYHSLSHPALKFNRKASQSLPQRQQSRFRSHLTKSHRRLD